jgi:hypothetical protein
MRVTQCHTCCTDMGTTAVEETKESSEHQPQPTPYGMGEKVGGPQHIQVVPDERTPGRRLLAFGGKGKPMAFGQSALRADLGNVSRSSRPSALDR